MGVWWRDFFALGGAIFMFGGILTGCLVAREYSGVGWREKKSILYIDLF